MYHSKISAKLNFLVIFTEKALIHLNNLLMLSANLKIKPLKTHIIIIYCSSTLFE